MPHIYRSSGTILLCMLIMQHNKTIGETVSPAEKDKVAFARQYARRHHAPVSHVLDMVAITEQQKALTRSLLQLKKS